MTDKLEVAEGTQDQGARERLIYTITTTEVGSDPSSPSVIVYDLNDNSDVTSTVMPTNSPTVSGDVITLSPLRSLIKGHNYRVQVLFTIGSQIFDHYIFVRCVI